MSFYTESKAAKAGHMPVQMNNNAQQSFAYDAITKGIHDNDGSVFASTGLAGPGKL